MTPYLRSAGFDTDIGAFIEGSSVSSLSGSMARLFIKDNIIAGEVLASGQTLRLGNFTMIARLAAEPTMTSRAIENPLRINSEHSKQMDPVEFSS